MPTPRITTFTLGPFETNCFVVSVPDGPAPEHCWIVDCGFDPEPMFEHIDEAGLRPQAVLLTHAHADHIAGLDEALSRYGRLPVYLHEAERGWCSDPMLNLSGGMGVPVSVSEPTDWLGHGQDLELAGTSWRVLHTPGHSPGGVVFLHEPSRQAIVGDVVFAGSIGRIDFPTSDPDAMARSLREVILGLPDDLAIHPGHGPASTIGRERAGNPYLAASP